MYLWVLVLISVKVMSMTLVRWHLFSSKTQALQVKLGRKHSCFQKMKTNPLSNLNKAKFLEWLDTKKKQTVKFRVVRGEGNTSDSDATESDDKDDSDDGNDSDKYININEVLTTGWASQ